MGQIEYPEQYIEDVFYLWYSGGRKQGNDFINSLPDAPDGRKPSKFTIIKWTETRGWVERADALDAQLSVSLDDIILQKRKEMFEERIKVADEVLDRGLEFLRITGIKTDATAVRAIELALSVKRDSVGAVESYAKIAKMSDEEIQKELEALLGKPKQNLDVVIDGEIDTESK